jgi:hypothetical protein
VHAIDFTIFYEIFVKIFTKDRSEDVHTDFYSFFRALFSHTIWAKVLIVFSFGQENFFWLAKRVRHTEASHRKQVIGRKRVIHRPL